MDETKLKSLFISVNTTLKQAMEKLAETSEKILFVVEEGDGLLGTVTDGDIRRGLLNGLKFSDTAKNVMFRGFISLRKGQADLNIEARKLMIERKVEQIPVLGDDGIITDVILWTDMLEEGEQTEPRQLRPNQIVIMAGGKGTRLDPFTQILPKPLIPLGNKPVIEHIMERYYKDGFHKFIYTLNYKKEYLKLFLKENNYPYIVDWVEEDAFWGTSGSLSLLKDKISDTFFVTNCDSLLDVNFEDVLKWHREHSASITIIGCHNEVKIPFGVLELSNGKLEKLLEKPTHDVIINTGVYVMEPHVISYIPERTHIDMNQLIEMVAAKEKVTVYPISGGWLDLGQWEEYKKNIDIIERINVR